MIAFNSEGAVEVLDILDHTLEEKVNLIPQKFINYLKENAAKDYVAKLDYSKTINDDKIVHMTMICPRIYKFDKQE